MSLPDDGERVFIFVRSVRMVPYVRNMIGDLRGARLAENAKFHAAEDVHQALHLMRGRPVDRVFVDHDASAAASALEWRKEFAAA